MPYRNVFRPARWILVFLVAFLGFTGAGVVFLYRREGVSWLAAGLSVLSMVFLFGIADWVVSKIVLGEETLDIVELFRRRSYPRSELVSAKVDGGHVCLELSQGGWVTLPDTGENALGVCDSVRAWLKKRERA